MQIEFLLSSNSIFARNTCRITSIKHPVNNSLLVPAVSVTYLPIFYLALDSWFAQMSKIAGRIKFPPYLISIDHIYRLYDNHQVQNKQFIAPRNLWKKQLPILWPALESWQTENAKIL